MRYLVCRSGARPLVFPSILYNVIFIIVLVICTFDNQKEAKYVLVLISIILVINNATWFYLYMQRLSSVTLESDAVRCSFLRITRRLIPYDEIVEYGEAWGRGGHFIYVSRIKLTDLQRTSKTFDLYRKTKNVIVLQYDEEVMEFLKTHELIQQNIIE